MDRVTTGPGGARALPQAVRRFVDSGYDLLQTHISWVLLGDREVYKIKKPVDLGFLDFSSLVRRHRACRAEVELNRRLTDGVYLGVVPLREGENVGDRASGPTRPPVVDYAVHMRRLDDADRADLLLQRGELTRARLSQLAEHLHSFHVRCTSTVETRRHGTIDAIRRNVQQNFDQTRPFVDDYVSAEIAEEIECWQLAFLESHADLFQQRLQDDRVRDGHGDLRLEHVYFERSGASEIEAASQPRIQVLDCIEFNDRYRFADVCADIAFLAMDLSERGHVDLAEHLLAEYARFAADYDLYRLVDFYESYRAWVRGKVLVLTQRAGDLDPAQGADLHQEARRHFLLAQASERRPLAPPRLICVGGWLASGKSTVSRQLADELACPRIAADWTRKVLFAREPTESVHVAAFEGLYSADATRRVYERCLENARAVLASGRSVIVDASFASQAFRQQARATAADLGVDFVFVECVVDRETSRQRLEQRDLDASVSDGRLEIFDDFVAHWEEVDELPPALHHRIDTRGPLAQSLTQLRALLPD